MKAIVPGSLLGLSLLLGGGQLAYAVPARWDNTWTPSAWTRGSTPGSLYAEWNNFNDDLPRVRGIQDLTPEVANFGGGAYRVEEMTGTAGITRGGNISSSRPMKFDFTVGNLGGDPSLFRDVHVRLATLGYAKSFTNFLLGERPGTYTHLFATGIGGPFGRLEVEALVSWRGVPNAPSYLMTWNAVAPRVTLDQLSVDVGPPVPVPGPVYLMASGLVALAAMARRKRQAV
jgi:hypothetical protein